jgi:hypothetical protein
MDAAARASMKQQKAGHEQELACDDVLRAMASCLVEDNSAVYHVEAQVDPEPPQFSMSKKPPREIFYRKTQLFAVQIPDEVGPKRCTCEYLCLGAPAVIKCLSCAIYDAKNLGFFCQQCFDSRHPWYRVPHIFEDIGKDESVAHTLKVSHRRAEMHRFEEEGKDTMRDLKKNEPLLDYVSDDLQLTDNLKDVGFRTTALEKQMRNFRATLRRDILSKPLERDQEIYPGGAYKLEMTDDEAANVIKRFYKGHLTRQALSRFVCSKVLRGFDEASGREFWYDKLTKRSSWKKPVLLLRSHAEMMPVKGAAGSKK